MRRRALPLLMAFLLLVPLAQAAGGPTGARTALTFDDEVNAIALSSSGGILAVAMDDPGSNLFGDRRSETWQIFFSDGRSVRQSGDVDPPECDNPISSDDCATDATHIAISRDGSRIAAAGSMSTTAGTIVFATANSGEIDQETVVGAVEGIAMSEDGTLVAVVTSLPLSSPQANKGRLYLFEWPAVAQGVTQARSLETAQPGVEVSVAPDGASVSALAGDDHVRMRRDGVNATDTGFPGIGTDTAVSASGRHLIVAGSQEGWFALYTDDSAANFRELRLRDESNPVTSVAIRRDATAIAIANNQGKVWVYAVDPAVPLVSRLLGSVTLSGSVTDVQFARNGLSLVASTGSTVAHYALTASGLKILWEAPRTGGYVGVGVEENGELVAAGYASSAVLFDAQHSIGVTAPASQTVQPNSTGSATFTVRNTGNRLETASLALDSPVGWAATLANSSVTLAPNETVTVQATWSAPAFASPGARDFRLRATMVGRTNPAAEATFQVTVPEVRGWDLEAAGPQSLGVPLGRATAFTATLTNTGNVPVTPPLAVSISDARWTVRIVGANTTVQGGQSTGVIVEMTPPAGAAELATATATLSVTGFPAETLQFTGTVGASFAVGLDVPAGVEVPMGNTTRVVITLRNLGNAVDGILAQLGTMPTGWSAAFLDGRTIYEAPQVAAGQSVTATIEVRAPANTTATPVHIPVTASSVAAPSQGASKTFLATAVQPQTSSSDSETDNGGDGGGNGIPGPAVPLALMALASLAAFARRRIR